jgi:putative tryptophan/tyrosine transport system substrate-binding protein
MIADSINDKGRTVRIGIIVAGSAPPAKGFKEGLAELGWIEDLNVNFAIHVAQGEVDRLPGFASDIVGLNVDIIAAIGGVTVRAVQKATSTIPIVFAVVVEPVGDGLATNLQCPGGNTTGVTTFDPHQAVAQLEFLKMLRPGLARVAILSDSGVSECLSNSNREAAKKLELRPQIIRVKGRSPDYEAAFSAMDSERAQALVVLEEPINAACRKQIADLAFVRRLPTVFPREQVDAGGLIAYGTSLREASQRMAVYADKILNGVEPGDLSIESALRHELVINLRIAREFGVTVPPELLARAAQLID